MLRQIGPFAIGGGLLGTGSAAGQEANQNETDAASVDEIELSSSSTADTVPSITEESELYLTSLDENGGSTSSVDGSNSSTKIVDQDPAQNGYVGFSVGSFSESRVYQKKYATAAAWVEWETDIDEPTSFEVKPKYSYISLAGSGSVSPFNEKEETSEWKYSETKTENNDPDPSKDEVNSEYARVVVPVLSGLISGSGSDAGYSISFVLQKLNVSSDSAAIVEEVEVTAQSADSEEHQEEEIRIITETLDTDSQYRLVCISHAESRAIGLAGGGGYVASGGGDGLLPGLWIHQVKVSPQGYDGSDPICHPGEPCPDKVKNN